MDVVERNLPVSMVRANLEGFPDYPLPPTYSVRWYQAGNEQLWVRIHLEAEPYATITPALYVREFGCDPKLLAQRQCFLFDAHENAIGTATAWMNGDDHGQPYGRLHWVAIVPDMQGKGLAKPLLTIVCKRMRELGHDRAYLCTSTARIPAINLYLQFGFVPEIHTAAELALWRELRSKLKEPLDLTSAQSSA